MANQIKHIRELCNQKRIDYMALYELVCKAIDDDDDPNKPRYPESTTVHKWLNKRDRKTISPVYRKYVAAALEIPERELISGEPDTQESEQLKNYRKQLEFTEEELDQIANLLHLGKYYTRVLTAFAAAVGIILIDISTWKNVWIALGGIVVLIVTNEYDKRRYRKDTGRKYSLKGNLGFFRGLKESKKTLYRVFIAFMCVTASVAFLPFLESLFYKGTYYVSGTVFLLLSAFFLVLSMFRD